MLVFSIILILLACWLFYLAYLGFQNKKQQQTYKHISTLSNPPKETKTYDSGFDVMLKNLKKIEIVPDVSSLKQKRKLASEIPEINYGKLTKSTKIEHLANFVVIDIETTGISLTNKIIEVCAIKFEDFNVVDCFSTLINPERDIPEDASKINHITNEMVEDSPVLHQIAQQLKDYVGTYPVVAHNAQFDLRHLFVRGIDFTGNKVYDTLQLAQKIIKKSDVFNYRLSTLCKYYGLILDNAHRAEVDCLATAFLFEELCEDKIEGYESDFLKQVFEKHEISSNSNI